MKIVVLEGSPNKNGSSNMLADSFIRGAKEAGHSVQVIDAAHAHIHPCIGCIHCGYEGPCVQKDDMETIRRAILDAEMMVFVTPLYYYGMSAQLKTLIDRFCAFNSSIQRKRMKSALQHRPAACRRRFWAPCRLHRHLIGVASSWLQTKFKMTVLYMASAHVAVSRNMDIEQAHELIEQINRMEGRYLCVITMDRSYVADEGTEEY